ncbi:MAG: YciI family protein [Angustibacter sp.]
MSGESPAPPTDLCSGTAFVLLVEYLAPLSRIDQLLDDHRAWLDAHFADGTFLVSGPQVPRVGGTILATGTSREDLDRRIASDPLVRASAARYDVVEFRPTRGPWAPRGA